MSGKVLALAVASAAVVGGAAGAAVNVWNSQREEAQRTDPAVAARLEAAEKELAAARSELDATRKSLADMQERVTSTELRYARDAGTAATGAAPADAAKADARPRRVRRFSTGFGAIDVEQALGEAQVALEGAEVALGRVVDEGGFAVGSDQIVHHLGGFGEAMKLRQLPEEERWQKAKDDLALSWNQVEDLKRAIEERDKLTTESMQVEQKTGPDGSSQITIQRPDVAKMAKAQGDYHEKVGRVLNDEQKKNWRSKGYDQAFGKSPFSSAIAISVQSIGVPGPKEPAKDKSK